MPGITALGGNLFGANAAAALTEMLQHKTAKRGQFRIAVILGKAWHTLVNLLLRVTVPGEQDT